jgi:tetratricopeptide (TPR) repeat protein
MDKTATIVEFRALVENLPTSKKNLQVAKNLVTFALDSSKSIGISDPDFLRILNAFQEAILFFINENKIRESSLLADSYINLLEDLNNSDEMIARTKALASAFFNKSDSAYHIYFEDLVNRVVSFLDDDSLLEELADLLLTIGYYLQKMKIHELAISYLDRGMTYLIDADNIDGVLKEIQKILESARVLATKNNEYSSHYIDLVNKISDQAKVDISKEPTTQLAYQSFSDHLIKSSKTMVESRFTQSGRLHKKKREFFKKKIIEED